MRLGWSERHVPSTRSKPSGRVRVVDDDNGAVAAAAALRKRPGTRSTASSPARTEASEAPMAWAPAAASAALAGTNAPRSFMATSAAFAIGGARGTKRVPSSETSHVVHAPAGIRSPYRPRCVASREARTDLARVGIVAPVHQRAVRLLPSGRVQRIAELRLRRFVVLHRWNGSRGGHV